MAIGRDIIGNLAKQFGYSKELVRDALASNQIDALTASLIGSRIDKLQQTRQEAGARTTVLEDILAPKPEEMMGQGIAAVPQEAPTALAALPSNLPTEEMAAGGIVAFAKGDLVEEEDEDDEIEAMEKSGLARLMATMGAGLSGLKGAMPQGGISLPKSYEAALAERGETPATVRKATRETPTTVESFTATSMPKRGGHKYEDTVIKEAERVGLDPNLAVHALYKETGGIKNPEAVRSRAGAIGIMQLMPGTAKELGVDPFDPEQNIRGGVMYLKKMMDKYNDPTLALAAYNAGPGRVDRALKSGKGIEALPRETQNYVVASRMAGGGIVAFQEGGISPEFGGYDTTAGIAATRPEIDEYTIDPMTGEKLFSGYRGPKKPKPVTTPLPAMGPTDEELGRFAPASAPAPEVDISKLIGGAQGEEKEEGALKKYMSLLEGREKASAEQRKTDAYMALLSAGLGMMGGTSPYAAVNIGQGAQAGVATQLAARKAQIADERATLAGFSGAAAAEEAAKQRRFLAEQGKESKIGTLIANREKQLETAAFNLVTKTGLMIDSAEGQAAIAREVQRLKSSDPLLSKLYKEYGLPPIQGTATAPQRRTPEEIKKQFKLS
jgi:hypothetical protein